MSERVAALEASLRDRDDGDDAPARVFQLPQIGAAVQAAVPGIYAWGLTVAPAAWSHGASVWAKVTAVLGVALLLFFAFREPALGWRARAFGVWSLIVTSVVTWGIAPSALSVSHIDVVRGVAGMCGWGAFAFASAAPAVRRRPEDEARVLPAAPLKARSTKHRSDPLYIVVGLLLAASLQTIGWSIPVVERALFVHLLTLACGVAIVGVSADLALARHVRRKRSPAKRSIRRAAPLFAVLVAMLLGGLALSLTHAW